MKSKEEILNSYYSQGADGMPEISADGLLKAMEEYRLQAEEAAFNAARLFEDDVIGGKDLYETFADYKASLDIPLPAPPETTEAQTIQFMADSIMEMFIPLDNSVATMSFDIRSDGKAYTVNYSKSQQGHWVFRDYLNR